MIWGTILLLVVMAGAGVLLFAGAAALMGWSLVHPPRMTDGKAAWVLRRLSPLDVGLAFEDVAFAVRDERGRNLKIAAWWVPNPEADGRCAVLVHGYADAKVGAIAWGPVWHAMGFNLLVLDLRAHGESGGSACTAGYYERSDLGQVIDQLRASRAGDTREIVLFGLSMGGAVALATAAQRSDVAAVVADGVYADFQRASMRHMERSGMPGRSAQRAALWVARRVTGADFDAVRPADLISQVSCPVLVIEGAEDSLLGPEDWAALEQAVGVNRAAHPASAMWRVERVEHLMPVVADPTRYRERVAAFLARAVQAATAR